MKKIVFTQRVEFVESYGERRDCADIEIAKLIWECGCTPIPISNIPQKTWEFVKQMKPDGIIFTGGNDLSKYGGNAPERDETEKKLLEFGIENSIPIYGFCRGMQIIADYFGAELKHVKNHVAVKHELKGDFPWDRRKVNSFHNMAVKAASKDLIVCAASADGVIEAITVRDKKIYGTMWHPERENPFAKEDTEFIRQIFCKE